MWGPAKSLVYFTLGGSNPSLRANVPEGQGVGWDIALISVTENTEHLSMMWPICEKDGLIYVEMTQLAAVYALEA